MSENPRFWLDKLVTMLAQIFLLALFLKSIIFLPDGALVGPLLQQILIAVILFVRARRKTPLLIIPDEILVTLPYLWMVAVIGTASGWSIVWLISLVIIFSICLLQITQGQKGFAGGLRNNSLLQAIWCSILFVLLMALLLVKVLPPFGLDLFRATILNLFVFVAGIPVSLSAFYRFVPVVYPASSAQG